MKRFLSILFILAFCLLPPGPVSAAASRRDCAGAPAAEAAKAPAAGEDAAAPAPLPETPPDTFDLRDYNLVSRAKKQTPWGTCWGFAAIAAAEISILGALRDASPENAAVYASPDRLDLSELQMAWFAYTPLPEARKNTVAPHSQSGEGLRYYGDYRLASGGSAALAVSMFSSGTGPIPEEYAPYRSREGVIVQSERGYPYYADRDMERNYYDWSVDESLRFASWFALRDANRLPAPWAEPQDGAAPVFRPDYIDAVKQELLRERGVVISCRADYSSPEDTPQDDQFLNTETWAQYCPDPSLSSDHAVCIVGWDDHYSRENFLPSARPARDGAWIVKNSWGGMNSAFANQNAWGIDRSGFFYLSYYDRTLANPLSYVFDAGEELEGTAYQIDQYDLLPALSGLPSTDADALFPGQGGKTGFRRAANVFHADTPRAVFALGADTVGENCRVTLELYALREGWRNPTDGKRLASVSSQFDYGGYHRLNLGRACVIPAGADYSVVARMEQIPVNSGLQWTGERPPREGEYVTVVVNPGESFYDAGNGKWMDWLDFTEAFCAANPVPESEPSAVLAVDNPGIKAYYSDADQTLSGPETEGAEAAAGAVSREAPVVRHVPHSGSGGGALAHGKPGDRRQRGAGRVRQAGN